MVTEIGVEPFRGTQSKQLNALVKIFGGLPQFNTFNRKNIKTVRFFILAKLLSSRVFLKIVKT